MKNAMEGRYKGSREDEQETNPTNPSRFSLSNALVRPKAKADRRAAWCEGQKPIFRALRGSPPQGSCDFNLLERISKGLGNSEDGTHCAAFRDISIAGLGTGHRRIQQS